MLWHAAILGQKFGRPYFCVQVKIFHSNIVQLALYISFIVGLQVYLIPIFF